MHYIIVLRNLNAYSILLSAQLLNQIFNNFLTKAISLQKFLSILSEGKYYYRISLLLCIAIIYVLVD